MSSHIRVHGGDAPTQAAGDTSRALLAPIAPLTEAWEVALELAELASKKYFSNPDRVEKLKRIPDLDGLRNRTEFQSLLKSLATTSG